MILVYFDASALIKRYAPELGTPFVNAAFEATGPDRYTCCSLSIAEVIWALVRMRNDGRLSDALHRQAVLEVETELIRNPHFRATSLGDSLVLASLPLIPAHNLNATDALILRSALDLARLLRATGDDLALCAADKRLLRAAAAEGLAVLDPETDPLERMAEVLGAEASRD